MNQNLTENGMRGRKNIPLKGKELISEKQNVTLTKTEKQRLATLATNAKVSRSDFMRRLLNSSHADDLSRHLKITSGEN